MLTRLARTCCRHRRIVLALWLVVFVLAIALGGADDELEPSVRESVTTGV